jgi:hypothetical protein
MNKNNSRHINLNNKFGKCCGCPGLVNDDRMFNNYISSRLRNDQIRKSLRIPTSHSYRSILQIDGQKFINGEIENIDNYKCKSDKKNKFYIDLSEYKFDKPLDNGYWGLQIENDGIKKSQMKPLNDKCTNQNIENHVGKKYMINSDKNY